MTQRLLGTASALLLTLVVGCGDDGVTVAPPPSETYMATEGEWTFIADGGMRCMDGSMTGFGVKLNDDARELMIYLEDGGACFNGPTCSTLVRDSFDADDMEDWGSTRGSRGVFSGANNPFADYSQVFVPFCTGDVHGGQRPDGPEGRVHVGYANVTSVLNSVSEAFSGRLDKVILAGSSAGGLGVYVNYEQTAEAFSDLPVSLLSDSGLVLSDDVLSPCLQQQIRDAWNFTPSLPSGCDTCTGSDGGGLTNVYEYLAETYGDQLFAVISSEQDRTFRTFYGFGNEACQNPTLDVGADVYAGGVADLASRLDPIGNMNLFVLEGNEHVFTYSDLSDSETGGVFLEQWLTEFEAGADGWDDVDLAR